MSFLNEQKCAFSIERDVTGRHGRQMLDLMASEEKDKGRKHQSVFKMRQLFNTKRV